MKCQKDTDQKILAEKLKSCYFEFISYLKSHSYENLLLKLSKRLHDLLHVKQIGFYTPDKWHRTYHLISHQIEEIPYYLKDLSQQHIYLLQEDLFDQSIVNGKEIFEQHFILDETLIIKIDTNGLSNYLLLVFKNNQLSEQMIQVIQQETNRFMEMLHSHYQNKERDRKKEFLLDLSSHLNSSKEKTEVISKLIASLQVLYPDFSYYLLMSHDYEADSGLPIKLIEYSDDVTKQISTQAFTSGEVQIEENTQNKNLYAPLTGNQGIYGVIQIIAPKTICFSDEEILFISKFAKTTGKAIENITLYQDSIHLVSNLKLINDVTHKMNLNLEFSELINIVKQEVLKISNAHQVGFVYYHEESICELDILEESTSFFHTENGHEFVEFLSNRVRKKREALFSGDFSKEFLNFPYRSLITIPMVESEEIHGFIIILHKDNSFFTFESFKLIKSLIHHSTLALTNAILRGKLEKAVITDYLTKLYSRSHLDAMLNKHMQVDKKGTLILLDIDDFKSINDTYGHYIGDEVIVQIANIIMENIDEEDIPSRWGGEEFAIYLPHKTTIEGIKLAQKLREQVAQETEPQVTFSCGISTWYESREDSVSEVFIRADMALYQAKGMGKNCICTSS